MIRCIHPIFLRLLLSQKIREKYPNKTIWLYTGSLWEEICNEEIVQYLDVCVDGEFQIDKRDTSLRWKGSSNQRVIDVPSILVKAKSFCIVIIKEQEQANKQEAA